MIYADLTPDEYDQDAIAMCDSAAVECLDAGDTAFAAYFWEAAKFYEQSISDRRSERIQGLLAAMASEPARGSAL